MAGSRTWRRRALAAAAIAVTTLALGACGGKDNTAQTGNAGTGDSVIGGAPSESATLGAAASAGSNGNGGGGSGSGSGTANSAPIYPKDAKGYVQELLKAMAKPDYARISQLAVQSATQQIKENVTSGGNPNSQWPYVACTTDTGANQSTCVARNSHGDELTVKVNQSQLGFPTAVTEAPLERTTYPSTPGDYVGALLFSYEKGNQQRMVRLSSDTVKSKITCSFGKQISVASIDGTYSKVTVDGIGVDLGKKYEFKVLTATGGKANAVKEVLSKQC
jgi:hypothetical protein